MDLAALVLSVEETRRRAHSAQPHAKVIAPRARWRVWAAMRRVVRLRKATRPQVAAGPGPHNTPTASTQIADPAPTMQGHLH